MPKEKQYKIVNARVEVLSGGPEPGFLVAELELQPQTAKGKPIFYTLAEVEACLHSTRLRHPYLTGL